MGTTDKSAATWERIHRVATPGSGETGHRPPRRPGPWGRATWPRGPAERSASALRSRAEPWVLHAPTSARTAIPTFCAGSHCRTKTRAPAAPGMAPRPLPAGDGADVGPWLGRGLRASVRTGGPSQGRGGRVAPELGREPAPPSTRGLAATWSKRVRGCRGATVCPAGGGAPRPQSLMRACCVRAAGWTAGDGQDASALPELGDGPAAPGGTAGPEPTGRARPALLDEQTRLQNSSQWLAKLGTGDSFQIHKIMWYSVPEGEGCSSRATSRKRRGTGWSPGHRQPCPGRGGRTQGMAGSRSLCGLQRHPPCLPLRRGGEGCGGKPGWFSRPQYCGRPCPHPQEKPHCRTRGRLPPPPGPPDPPGPPPSPIPAAACTGHPDPLV